MAFTMMRLEVGEHTRGPARTFFPSHKRARSDVFPGMLSPMYKNKVWVDEVANLMILPFVLGRNEARFERRLDT